MNAPSATQPTEAAPNSHLLRIAIWVAIGALIAAAIVCVIMVLVGSANGIVGRAFLTILLLAAFAGVALLDAHLAPRRPVWFVLLSMVVWVVTLLIGAIMIWLPERPLFNVFYEGYGFSRFFSFLLIVLILQLMVLHIRLYTKAWLGRGTRFTTVVGWITLVLVALLALMLVFPLMLNEYVDFHEIYWRLTVSAAILAAVGTALVPLVNALFAPRAPYAGPVARVAPAAALGPAAPTWPRYADGFTPLPVLPDGTPDWDAYYTGHPTVPAAAVPPQQWPAPTPEQQVPAATPPAAPGEHPTAGYQGYPPPPPLPPHA